MHKFLQLSQKNENEKNPFLIIFIIIMPHITHNLLHANGSNRMRWN